MGVRANFLANQARLACKLKEVIASQEDLAKKARAAAANRTNEIQGNYQTRIAARIADSEERAKERILAQQKENQDPNSTSLTENEIRTEESRKAEAEVATMRRQMTQELEGKVHAGEVGASILFHNTMRYE